VPDDRHPGQPRYDALHDAGAGEAAWYLRAAVRDAPADALRGLRGWAGRPAPAAGDPAGRPIERVLAARRARPAARLPGVPRRRFVARLRGDDLLSRGHLHGRGGAADRAVLR